MKKIPQESGSESQELLDDFYDSNSNRNGVESDDSSGKDLWLRKRLDKQDRKIDEIQGSLKGILHMLKNANLAPQPEQFPEILKQPDEKFISSPKSPFEEAPEEEKTPTTEKFIRNVQKNGLFAISEHQNTDDKIFKDNKKVNRRHFSDVKLQINQIDELDDMQPEDL